MTARLSYPFLCVLASLLLAQPASAQTYRMVPDPGTNHHDALVEFLESRAFWPDDISAVLDPLEGRLDREHGTHRVAFVATLEDIPGLRPLPEGVVDFVHRNHNVFYLDVADERLLLGISREVVRENGRTISSEFHFETFDLIRGALEDNAGQVLGDPLAVVFFRAHGQQFGLLGRLFLLGGALLVFLAARVRRARVLPGDPVVAAHRLAAARFSFRLGALTWILLLAAIYGFAHFSAHLQFLNMAAVGGGLSYQLIDRLVGQPDHLRLLSFISCMISGVALVLLLSLWAGLFQKGSPRRRENWP